MSRIYLDIDDVLADFRAHVIAQGVPKYTGTWYTSDPASWTAEQHHIDNETNAMMARAGFWLGIPVAEGAFEIIAAAASRAGAYLLTALPPRVSEATRSDIAAQKLEWADSKLHFPVDRVFTVMREEKADFCRGPSTALVDDNGKTCNEWSRRGGTAITHTDWRVTVEQIKERVW